MSVRRYTPVSTYRTFIAAFTQIALESFTGFVVHVDGAERTCIGTFLTTDTLVGIYLGDASNRIHGAGAGRAYSSARRVSTSVATNDKGFTVLLISDDSYAGIHLTAFAVVIQGAANNTASASGADFIVVNQLFLFTHN